MVACRFEARITLGRGVSETLLDEVYAALIFSGSRSERESEEGESGQYVFHT
jgi:hypothetical protein